MFKQNYILSVVFVATVILLAFMTTKEKFDPNYSSQQEMYITTSQSKTDYPLTISSGDVQKYKTETEYLYLLKFNLPESNAPFQTQDLTLPFNQLIPYIPYEVYADSTKVGELKRSGDGWFKMEFRSKQSHKDFKVYLGKSLVGATTLP